jgi:hypothetical protein
VDGHAGGDVHKGEFQSGTSHGTSFGRHYHCCAGDLRPSFNILSSPRRLLEGALPICARRAIFPHTTTVFEVPVGRDFVFREDKKQLDSSMKLLDRMENSAVG